MDLRQALRLTYGSLCLAFVGAGGKTSAMFRLGRDLSASTSVAGEGPVFLTTTTHLAKFQTSLADVHWSVDHLEDLQRLITSLPGGLILITGHEIENDRIAGPSSEVLHALHAFARNEDIPLLIEADGSRQLPIKAPAEHEPALPPFVDHVLVMQGLSALGRPLNREWVHRPELVMGLTGLSYDEPLQAEDLARLLLDPGGGLKGIPLGIPRSVMLNQADTPELRTQAEGLVQLLLPAYDQVLVASLQQDEVYAVFEPTAAVVLAAGRAQRFGGPKQLLPWGDQPVIRRIAQTALDAGLAPVVIVVGAYSEVVIQALEGLPVVVIQNPDWAAGLSTSVRVGLEALPARIGGVFFLLADQPQISEKLLAALASLHAHNLPAITAPRVAARRANPALFDRSVFPELANLQGDVGGRVLFQHHAAAWLDWEDPTLLLDVDTPEDYQELLKRCPP